MMHPTRTTLPVCLLGAAFLSPGANLIQAQNAPADHPVVTVKGQTYTPQSILARNMGTPEDQTTQFPPHKIVGNIYYVGTKTLSSFLIVTPQGNILIDSTYERNVKTIEKSVTDLGFKFSDVRILLGNHAHGDHPSTRARRFSTGLCRRLPRSRGGRRRCRRRSARFP